MVAWTSRRRAPMNSRSLSYARHRRLRAAGHDAAWGCGTVRSAATKRLARIRLWELTYAIALRGRDRPWEQQAQVQLAMPFDTPLLPGSSTANRATGSSRIRICTPKSRDRTQRPAIACWSSRRGKRASRTTPMRSSRCVSARGPTRGHRRWKPVARCADRVLAADRRRSPVRHATSCGKWRKLAAGRRRDRFRTPAMGLRVLLGHRFQRRHRRSRRCRSRAHHEHGTPKARARTMVTLCRAHRLSGAAGDRLRRSRKAPMSSRTCGSKCFRIKRGCRSIRRTATR